MPLNIDTLESSIVPEEEPSAGPGVAARQTAEQLARLQAAGRQAKRDAERTRAEGFDD